MHAALGVGAAQGGKLLLLGVDGHHGREAKSAHVKGLLKLALQASGGPDPAKGASLVLLGQLLLHLDQGSAPAGLRVPDVGQEGDEADLDSQQ